jgi:hypothetical protein
MSEGAVLGKGNAEWNYSASHGSGRKKARTDTRSLSLDEYRKEMRGIWSSVICKDAIVYLSDSVEVAHRLKPL